MKTKYNIIPGDIEDVNDNRFLSSGYDVGDAVSFLFNGSLCSLEANRTFQSTTNQMILWYKATRDYDIHRLVFTFQHGEGVVRLF